MRCRVIGLGTWPLLDSPTSDMCFVSCGICGGDTRGDLAVIYLVVGEVLNTHRGGRFCADMSVKLTVFDLFARLAESSSRPASVSVVGRGAGLEEDRSGKAGLGRMLKFLSRWLVSGCLQENVGVGRRAAFEGGRTII